jgi:hypothetical protein
MIHFYNSASGHWEAIDNPDRFDVERILEAVERPCMSCDADVLFRPGSDDSPDIVIEHEANCPNAA